MVFQKAVLDLKKVVLVLKNRWSCNLVVLLHSQFDSQSKQSKPAL